MKEYIEKAEVLERVKFVPIASSGAVQEEDVDAWADGTADAVDAIYKSLSNMSAADVVEVVRGKWKYFRKQNIAVCTNCSFERDLDANFGRAISCPNCGADMREE